MARPLALWFALAVLAAHLVLLQVLGSLGSIPSQLKTMAVPFFTRELRSNPPPLVTPVNLTPKKSLSTTGASSIATKSVANETPLPTASDSTAVTATETVATLTPAAPPTSVSDSTEGSPNPGSLQATGGAGFPQNALGLAAAPVQSNPSSATTTTAVRQDSWPTDTRLSYALSGNFRGAISGTARVQWQRDRERYQVRVELDLSGVTIYTMTSQGKVTPQGLEPAVYEEKRLGTKPLQVTMDAQTLRLADGNRVDKPEETQDTASQFVELGHRFATGRAALEVGKTVQLWLARPNAVAEWTYDIVGLDTLTSPQLGPILAYHLKPRPLLKPGGPVTAEMWFAPSLQYLPVRIRITLNTDTWVDMQIEKIEQADRMPDATTAVPASAVPTLPPTSKP